MGKRRGGLFEVLIVLAFLTACGGGGAGDPSPVASGTPSPTNPTSGSTAGSTAGVLCAYSTSMFNASASVNAQSTSAWNCNTTARLLSGNGIPDHPVGTFPNPDNPNAIRAQTVSATYTLTPSVANANGTFAVTVGHALNGIKIEPDTGGTCDNTGANCVQIGGTGTWRMEALGQTAFRFGTDASNAHVQPTGVYHYHGLPEGLISKLGKGMAMTLIGWAADGFPIYARYGYSTANNAASPLKVLTGSYRKKAVPDANRPSVTLYAMGTFKQDWEYVAGLGDLDECNGRTGVTPEFPAGTYHYLATESYPYMPRCLKGAAAGGGGGGPPPPPGG